MHVCMHVRVRTHVVIDLHREGYGFVHACACAAIANRARSHKSHLMTIPPHGPSIRAHGLSPRSTPTCLKHDRSSPVGFQQGEHAKLRNDDDDIEHPWQSHHHALQIYPGLLPNSRDVLHAQAKSKRETPKRKRHRACTTTCISSERPHCAQRAPPLRPERSGCSAPGTNALESMHNKDHAHASKSKRTRLLLMHAACLVHGSLRYDMEPTLATLH